jgi:L-type amino acid transporter 5
LISRPATNAILALTFAQYSFAAFFPHGCIIPPLAVQLMAAIAILILTWLNCHSVKLTTKIQNVFMFGKIIALLMIIGVGSVSLINGISFLKILN